MNPKDKDLIIKEMEEKIRVFEIRINNYKKLVKMFYNEIKINKRSKK